MSEKKTEVILTASLFVKIHQVYSSLISYEKTYIYQNIQ